MPGVFRRRWFPRLKRSGISSISATLVLTGVESTSQLGSFAAQADRGLTGVAATAQLHSPTPSIAELQNGVEATTAAGSMVAGTATNLSSVVATTQIASFGLHEDNNPALAGLVANALVGILAGDHPSVFESGVFATAQFENLLQQIPWAIFGLQVIASIPAHPFFMDAPTTLSGVKATALSWGAAGAGGGGGGSAGLYGPGQRGFDGASSGDGGHGGYADGGIVPGANTEASPGASGNELAPGYGSGSGGAGASFDTAVGATTYNANGSVFISYTSTITGKIVFVVLTIANNGNPFIIPNDWSNTNAISLVGSGCATVGEFTILTNLSAYSPGDAITFHIAAYCEGAPTTWDIYSANSGSLTPPITGGTGGDGGLYGGGGGGGTGGAGGHGGDGLIFLQYKSSFDNTTIVTVVLKVADNAGTPYTIPADWSVNNFVYLSGSGGDGDVGSTSQGGNGGAGGGITGAYDTNVFTPGQHVPYFVSPGGSELPTIFGDFAASSGANGKSGPPTNFNIFNELLFLLPCGEGGGGDGSVGPPRLIA